MNTNQSLTIQNDKPIKFSNFISGDVVKGKILETLGNKANSARFTTAIMSAVSNNPALQECVPMSILNCALLGEGLKLSPSPQLGHYYMVPFSRKQKNKEGKWEQGPKQATFQLGYKGYIQLAIRSGQYQDIDVIAIREGEYKGRNSFSGKNLFEFFNDELLRLSKPIIGYLAYFEMNNGFKKAIYWSKERMEKHADQYSQAFNLDIYKKLQEGKKVADEWKYSSFWYKSFDDMAFKTMLRQLISKWGIMSIEIEKAYSSDMAEIDGNGNASYNKPSFEENLQDEIEQNQGSKVLIGNKKQSLNNAKLAPKKKDGPQF
jgi:recombination protein RecT